MIGEPYQHIVPLLPHGQNVALTYRLLKRDVEAVTVRVQYLTRSDDHTVFLRKDESQDLPTITSAQSAQQGQLGTQIRYNLTLERLAKSEQTFSLVVLNLPPQIPFTFLDPKSGARITQVGFTEQIYKQNIDFEISIPQKLDQQMVDQTMNLDILVMRPEEVMHLDQLRRTSTGPSLSPQALAPLKASRLRLILIPKGIGKLELLVANLFAEIKQQQAATFQFGILNSGTLDLTSIVPSLDLPLGWEGGIEPHQADLLPPGQKTLFRAAISPPADTPIGEYSIRIQAKGYSGVESVEPPFKDFTIKIVPTRSITGTSLLLGGLLIVVLLITLGSVKVARR
jgi:uncharacterized membrane protein